MTSVSSGSWNIFYQDSPAYHTFEFPYLRNFGGTLSLWRIDALEVISLPSLVSIYRMELALNYNVSSVDFSSLETVVYDFYSTHTSPSAFAFPSLRTANQFRFSDTNSNELLVPVLESITYFQLLSLEKHVSDSRCIILETSRYSVREGRG